MSTVTRYFLGSNSRYGFASLYNAYLEPEAGDFLYVIKGGPGCGKSSFMKKLGSAAESAGLPVEYIHCSGDPDSLDAVYLPSLRLAYADGTAPHVLDAVYPGAAALYLDLGRFYDREALLPRLDEIAALNRRYKRYYDRAYDCLAAAAAVAPKGLPELWGEGELERVRQKAAALSGREFGRGQGGRVQKRFLRAISCKGEVFFSETLESLCERVCTLDNELGLAHFYLESIAEKAVQSGRGVILCPDPLDPKLTEAVLLPELGLGFLAVDGAHPYESKVYRHYRLDRLVGHETLSAARPAIRQARTLHGELLRCGMDALAQAKALHDELEAIYNPHVNFDGVYQEAEKHIAAILERA